MRTEPIRILHFINSTHAPGGVEEHLYCLAERLPEEGFDVSIVCPSHCCKFFAPLASGHIKVINVDLHQTSDLAGMRRLRQILTSERIEIAHSHQFFSTFFLAPIAKLARVAKVVETTHVREAWRQGWLGRSYLVDRIWSTMVDGFIAVSDANRKHLQKAKHCPTRKIHVIHNGRDLDRFHDDPVQGAELRARYGIGSDVPLLICVGRLEPQKGHRFLIDAMKHVRASIPAAKLILIGQGRMEPEIRSTIVQYGLEGAILIAGQQSDVRPFYDAADLVVLPSLWEGLPLVAVEAAAMGRAIVATDVDGTPEIVQDRKTGILVPPANSERLSMAILELLTNVRRRDWMGEQARHWAEGHFSFQQQLKRTARLYRRLLSVPPPLEQHEALYE